MKRKLTRIVLTGALLLAAWLIDERTDLPMWQTLMLYIIPYFVIGYDVMAESIEGIMEGNPFDENFLMSVATIGALLIGFLPDAEPQFVEGVSIMIFFQLGEMFEHYAEDKSRKSISELMDIRPDTATVERNGTTLDTAPDDVQVGETIVVRPGERIPLDGNITDGSSSLNTVALTGESAPRDVTVGDEVFSGSINISGLLKVRVVKPFSESTASKIINLVENAAGNKSKSESFIRRFARIYTPIVVMAAILVAFVPPLFQPDYSSALSTWLYRALTFLVVSCPCAFVISIPLTFFCGIGGAGHEGILIKGGNYMEGLAKIGTMVFDKTGTLTHGVFEVKAVHPNELTEKELLHMAAHVERFSTHPIAAALRNAYRDENDDCKIENITELAGQGIRAKVNGRTVCVGNEAMMVAIGTMPTSCQQCHELKGTTIHVAIDGRYAGHIVIADKVKDNAKEAIAALKQLGVRKTVMLTGDRKEVGEHVAKELGIDICHSELLPADKVGHVEHLLGEKTDGQSLAFVGDGINDAPVLTCADVGIAMGGLGSDAAIEAADVVLMDDSPSKIAKAMRISRRTISIAMQNAVFAIGVKVAILLLSTIGLATMSMAVFADVGVMVLTVFNAMRALKGKAD